MRVFDILYRHTYLYYVSNQYKCRCSHIHSLNGLMIFGTHVDNTLTSQYPSSFYPGKVHSDSGKGLCAGAEPRAKPSLPLIIIITYRLQLIFIYFRYITRYCITEHFSSCLANCVVSLSRHGQ